MLWTELILIIVSGALVDSFPGSATAHSNGVLLTKIDSVSIENPENSQIFGSSGNSGREPNSTQQKDDFQCLQEKALLLPEILQEIFHHLELKDRKNAAQVCKIWYHEFERFERMRNRCNIIPIDLALFYSRGEQRRLLKRYNEYSDDRKRSEWRPKLMIIFQEMDGIICSSLSWSTHDNGAIANVINNSRIFAAGAYLPSAIQIDYNQTTALMAGNFFGYIFPEALLNRRNVDVDVIFPPLQLFCNKFKLFADKPEHNKQLFEDLFHWKKEIPIKLAIVMSRKIPEDRGQNGAYLRAKEMCRFLKSLPESENMPICITLDYEDRKHPDYNPRSDGPLAVILFGGKEVHAAAYFSSNSYCKESGRKFKEWKDKEHKCMSKATQTIGFRMVCASYLIVFEYISENVLGVDLKGKEVSGHNNVFGLTKTQKYDEAQLDKSRQENCIGIIVVGFE